MLGDQGRVRACMRRHLAGRGAGNDPAGGRVDRRIGGPGRRPTTSGRVTDRSKGRRSGGAPRRRGGPTSGVVAAPGLQVGRRAGADTGAGAADLLVAQAPVVPRRRHHAGPVEGHREMVRARLAGPAPPVRQGHPVAQGRRRQQQLRPVRPSQASPRGRPQTRHRDQGLQPLHDHRATVPHQLPGRDARPDDLDPRGEALPRRARPRARPQPRSRPRQLPHLHQVRTARSPGGQVLHRGVRRHVGRHGDQQPAVLRARAAQARLGRSDRLRRQVGYLDPARRRPQRKRDPGASSPLRWVDVLAGVPHRPARHDEVSRVRSPSRESRGCRSGWTPGPGPCGSWTPHPATPTRT